MGGGGREGGNGGNGKERKCHNNKGRTNTKVPRDCRCRIGYSFAFQCWVVQSMVVLGRSRKQQPHPPIDPAGTHKHPRQRLFYLVSIIRSHFTYFIIRTPSFRFPPPQFFFILPRFWTNRMSAPPRPTLALSVAC